MSKGKLYLLPNLLNPDAPCDAFFPPKIREIVPTLDGLIAESEKSARKYLKSFSLHLPIHLCNKHCLDRDYQGLVELFDKGGKFGLISDCGLPAIADPGAKLVSLLQQKVSIEAISGPSSIIMALQLSGLSGQRFTFWGYLPRKEEELKKQLKLMESRSKKENATQIWMEAPYRSKKMFAIATEILDPKTLFCVAKNLTFAMQKVITKPIRQWDTNFDLENSLTVFLLYSNRFKN